MKRLINKTCTTCGKKLSVQINESSYTEEYKEQVKNYLCKICKRTNEMKKNLERSEIEDKIKKEKLKSTLGCHNCYVGKINVNEISCHRYPNVRTYNMYHFCGEWKHNSFFFHEKQNHGIYCKHNILDILDFDIKDNDIEYVVACRICRNKSTISTHYVENDIKSNIDQLNAEIQGVIIANISKEEFIEAVKKFLIELVN